MLCINYHNILFHLGLSTVPIFRKFMLNTNPSNVVNNKNQAPKTD